MILFWFHFNMLTFFHGVRLQELQYIETNVSPSGHRSSILSDILLSEDNREHLSSSLFFNFSFPFFIGGGGGGRVRQHVCFLCCFFVFLLLFDCFLFWLFVAFVLSCVSWLIVLSDFSNVYVSYIHCIEFTLQLQWTGVTTLYIVSYFGLLSYFITNVIQLVLQDVDDSLM